MQLWLERYILPICVAVVFGIAILNPFKMDWRQRLSLIVAISAFAYFWAHTLHKPKVTAAAESDQRISFLEREIEALRSQQKQLEDRQARSAEEKQRRQTIRGQLAGLLKEGRTIQNDIEFNNPGSVHEKQTWENRVEGYLRKNLDESYATRFRSPSHQVTHYPMGMNTNMLAPWGDITAKMAMLNDFISELRD